MMWMSLNWPTFAGNVEWLPTRNYLHLVSQMLGKLRLGLAPPLPEWHHTPLALTPRGLTTGWLPTRGGAVEASLDIVAREITITTTSGDERAISLFPARPIADVWSEFERLLAELGVPVELWDKPQEQTDVMPFAQDHRSRDYVPELARGWLAVLTEVQTVFDTWRSPFFGRSGVQFWWGGFDMTVTLFNGRHATPPPKGNYIQRYDLDAEHLTVGFWPGDESDVARFFGYVVPEPPGCVNYKLGHPSASWAPGMGEWVLPYDAVRQSSDRPGAVREFADTIYGAARDLGGWRMDEFSYARPPGRSTRTA